MLLKPWRLYSQDIQEYSFTSMLNWYDLWIISNFPFIKDTTSIYDDVWLWNKYFYIRVIIYLIKKNFKGDKMNI